MTLRPLLCAAAAASLAACAAPSVDDQADPAGADEIQPGPIFKMPLLNTRIAESAAPSNAHLTYYGGPVIPNVKVYTVFWNANVASQTQLNSFYSTVTQSPYMDWLTEYNTSNQTIGRGSFGGSVVDTMSGSAVDDTQIQKEVSALIDAGKLPASDGNNLYMVHFPPGVTITQGGEKSCQVFCAYHGTFSKNGKYVYYGVIPDMGGACANGCGTSTQFNNTTEVASHEMIEAVTDAAVGVAQNLAAPLAWYDQNNGEIGDICNGQGATVSGYQVQLEWSNASHACIATKTVQQNNNDFSITLSPASRTIAAGASATYTVTTALTSGSQQSVKLTVSGLPAGTTGSFNPASLTVGSSSTLTLTVAANATAATTNFTITATGTSVTHTAGGAVTVSSGNGGNNGGGGGGNLIVNGGFESATFSGWTVVTGVDRITNVAHGGSYGARVGNLTSYAGDSILYQKIAVPAAGKTTLGFYYILYTQDSYQYDQQQAFITDVNGNPLATIFDTCANQSSWKQATVDLTPYAGQTVLLYFLAHDDGYYPTYLRVDDVSVTNQ